MEKSELLSGLLKKRGVPHSVLNAKQHADEAKVVALAGHKGAVTVATNMAGRGTDIMLGGSTEFLADQELRKQGLDPVENAEEYNAAWPATLERITEQVKAEHDEVKEAGGLYVLGTERHESRRIDNQLRGRSGRQGDPGESRFYLSLDDDLMRLFKSDWVERVLVALKVPDDVPIENKSVTKSIESAQSQVEALNFESRKNVLEVRRRDEPAARGHLRRASRGARGRRPARPGPPDDRRGRGDLRQRRDRELPGGVGPRRAVDRAEDDLPGLAAPPGPRARGRRPRRPRPRHLLADLQADAQKAYDAREAEVGSEVMRELERQVLLSVLDRKWREHLYEMDYLREGIGLRAYSQRDPLVEYQREGFDMFNAMKEGIREETVGFLFNLEVEVEEEDEEAEIDVDLLAGADTSGASGLPRGRARSTRGNGHEHHAPHIFAKGLQPARRRRTSPTPRPARTARPRCTARRRPTPTTRTPAPAATRCAPAARARSTRGATAPRAARPT